MMAADVLHAQAPAQRSAASIPGPRGWPFIGALPAFARDPLAFLDHLAATYGDLARFRIVDHTIVYVGHPDAVEELLVRDHKQLHKDVIYDLLRPALGNGLVTSEDAQWKRNRKLAAPSFTARHVEVYAAAMVRCARHFAEGLVDGAAVDLHALMMDVSREIVLQTLFGSDLEVDATPVAEALDVVMETFVAEAQRFHRLIPKGIPTPLRRRHVRAIETLDRTIYGLIEARRTAGLGDDLLSRLISANDDDGGFSDVELRDEAVTAFVAGHETTALALTYTHVLVQQHPAVRDALMAEVDTVLDGRDATAADVRALPYTTAVIQEAMRVLPPVWAIGREATSPITLAGHAVPPGTQLLVAPWVMHRDPRFYDDPLVFRPERWLDGLEARLPRMAYLPFGAGPRVCIGKHFAMLEAVLVLATVVQQAWIAPTHGVPPRMASITMRPTGPVPAVVSRRARRGG